MATAKTNGRVTPKKAKSETADEFDVASLTFQELCDMEDAVGADAVASLLAAVDKKQRIPMRSLVAMLWIVRRRENPKFTLRDAMALPVVEAFGE